MLLRGGVPGFKLRSATAMDHSAEGASRRRCRKGRRGAEYMFAGTMMKAVLKFIGLLVLGVIMLWIAAFLLLGGPKAVAHRRHFDHLVKTADHQALLAAAIPAIEATTNQVTFHGSCDHYPSISNLPPIIHQMKPYYVAVDPERLRMEFHGGFDHYGFEIRKRDQWELSWYTEHGHHPLLTAPITGKANQASQARSLPAEPER